MNQKLMSEFGNEFVTQFEAIPSQDMKLALLELLETLLLKDQGTAAGQPAE